MTDRVQTARNVAIVTGAAGDIGAAIAAKLSTSYTVAAVDIDTVALKTRTEALLSKGISVSPFECDITDPAALAELAKAVSNLGNVEVLVNNAGAAAALSLSSMTSEALSRDIGLNLEAALNCFKAFEKSLINCKDGKVVNIVSVNGLAVFGHPAYSAAKAGLIQATRSIAVEYGKHGLRANAVAPGTVKTQAWHDRAKANPEVFEEALTWYPYEVLPEPSDIAEAVAFLISPQARCITGVCLPVDSGLSAGSPPLPATFTQSEDYL